MVGTDGIPEPVANELRRLQPRTIIVLGGTAAVTAQIETLLDQFVEAGTGERVRGMQVTRDDIDAARRSLT
jgi:putative cell wall-binding protein